MAEQALHARRPLQSLFGHEDAAFALHLLRCLFWFCVIALCGALLGRIDAALAAHPETHHLAGPLRGLGRAIFLTDILWLLLQLTVDIVRILMRTWSDIACLLRQAGIEPVRRRRQLALAAMVLLFLGAGVTWALSAIGQRPREPDVPVNIKTLLTDARVAQEGPPRDAGAKSLVRRRGYTAASSSLQDARSADRRFRHFLSAPTG